MAQLAFMTMVLLKAPRADPLVAGFMERIADAFAEAEAAPGFIDRSRPDPATGSTTGGRAPCRARFPSSNRAIVWCIPFRCGVTLRPLSPIPTEADTPKPCAGAATGASFRPGRHTLRGGLRMGRRPLGRRGMCASTSSTAKDRRRPHSISELPIRPMDDRRSWRRSARIRAERRRLAPPHSELVRLPEFVARWGLRFLPRYPAEEYDG